jgi:hypothetical protein
VTFVESVSTKEPAYGENLINLVTLEKKNLGPKFALDGAYLDGLLGTLMFIKGLFELNVLLLIGPESSEIKRF